MRLLSAYDGVRILDFSQGLAGPMAAMLMGDFEADVVKIEPPQGDRLKDHPGYLTFNRNKRIMNLDLERPEDLARAKSLIADDDGIHGVRGRGAEGSFEVRAGAVIRE